MLVILVLILVLLCKLVELIFRVAARVPFDESRNSKSGGLLGAFRKKGFLGFKRGHMQSRRAKNTTGESNQARPGHMHKESDIDNLGAIQRTRRPSELRPQSGFLSSDNRAASAGRYNQAADDDDAGYIMSAWHGSGAESQVPGYMAPGVYSAVHTQQDAPGFSVVRGGRANDTNPYLLQDPALPAGAAARPTYDSRMSYTGTSRGNPAGIDTFATLESQNDGRNPVRRARAASQSAIVEFVAQGETSPNPAISNAERDTRRQSAPIPASPRAPSSPQNPRRPTSGIASSGWKRESSAGSGFFHNLFRGNTKSGEGELDDWSDSDDSDVETLARSHRRWPFSRNKRKSSHGALSLQNIQPTSAEADEEERALEAWRDAPPEEPSQEGGTAGPSSGKSFVVVRQPNPR